LTRESVLLVDDALIQPASALGAVEWGFWDVHNPERTVVIELDYERFARLVLEVQDPQGTAASINGAVAKRA